MTKVKQPHYLPRAAYLSLFADKGRITVYDLGNDKEKFTEKRHFKTTPEKFGKQNNLYEVPRLPDNTLEKILQPIEDGYQHLYENKISLRQEPTREDLKLLSLFIATLEVRIPAQKEHWDQQLERMKEMGIQMSLAHGSRSAADRWEKQVENAQQHTFETLLLAAIKVNRWWFHDCCFLYIEKEERDQFFITSDNPVSHIDYTMMNSFYGLPPTSRTLEVTIPISRTMAIFINNAGITGYRPANINFVRDINNRTTNHASKYIISPHELDDNFYQGIYQHYPQSLILHHLELPESNMDKELAKYKGDVS